MRLCLFVFILFFSASSAHASAWMREKGTWFIANAINIWSSLDRDEQRIYDPTLFAEVGVTDRVTVGVDYYSGEMDTLHTGFVFARFPLGDLEAPDKFSVGFGFGGQTNLIEPITPLLRGSVAWGRGLSSGWVAVDASATYNRDTEIWRPKADFTWGHNLSDSWAVMLQLQSGRGQDDSRYANLAPNIIYTFNDNLRVTLGGLHSLNDDESAIRMGFWQSF